MDFEEIKEDILNHYTKETFLFLLFYFGEEVKGNETKSLLADKVIEGFDDSGKFNKLFNSISENARLFIKHLTWDGISTVPYIDSKYHIKTWVGDFYYNTNDLFIKKFKQYNCKEILFSTGLRDLFKKQIKMETFSNINSFCESNINIADDKFITNISGIIEYLKLTGSDSRPPEKKALKRDINKLNSSFKLSSLVPGLREEYILRFLSLINFKTSYLNELKNGFKRYIRGTLSDDNIDSYIFYPFIKGLNRIPNIDIFLKRGRYSFFQRILKCKSWCSVEDLVRELSLKEDTHIFDTSYFGSLMEVNLSTKITLLQKQDNEILLLRPLLRGIIFLLYSLGGADIVINPDNKEYDFSPLEGLTHFRITDIGWTLLGKVKDFTTNTVEISPPVFYSKKLFVIISEGDIGNRIFFQSIGMELDKNVYKLSYKSLLSAISTENELSRIHNKLEELLGNNDSLVWKEFIDGINDRIYPIYNEQQLIVVNFPKNNKEFIDIVINNENIRDLYYMVVDFRGAFTKKNFKEFKKVMKDYGFII